ncbi:hypothetical protein Tco_0287682 [Tanacetum coccineum]
MKDPILIQVSRPGELKRHLQHWKHFGRLYLIVIVLIKDENVETLQELRLVPIQSWVHNNEEFWSAWLANTDEIYTSASADGRKIAEEYTNQRTEGAESDGQVTVLQGQQGPAGGPAQPGLPEDTGSSS